jgi:type I restriction enzyme S subunit
MSFPRYGTYKDSGVEWLGEVPAHWKSLKFRFVFEESGEKITSEVVGPMLSVSGYRGIEVKEYDDENRRRLEDELVGYRIVRVGQLVVNTMWLNHTGLGVSDHEGHVSPAYRAYSIIGPVAPSYAHHLMRSKAYVQAYTSYLTGIRPNSLQMSREDLLQLPILLPPLPEQRAIAAFLDRETAKIDALVAEQQRLIALLKEKRQAVISHAVTKGLNPEAPMKDSGVEWLGEVPAHWEVTRLKFVADVQTGVAKGKDLAGRSVVSVPYLRVANVQDGYVDLADVAMIDLPVEELERYRLRNGDVLMNEGGDFDKLGRGHIWRAEIEPCIHQNHVFAVRPRLVSAEWLNTVTGSAYAQFYFMGRSKQTTNLASISSSNIMELPVVLPPVDEQSQLLRFIEREARRADTLVVAATSATALLQERRAALISAAVTGQIDVRGLAQAEAA